MLAEELREILLGRAFRAIRLYMADGSTVDIRHPELLKIGKTLAVVTVSSPIAPDSPAKEVFLSLMHVVRMQWIEPKASDAGAARGEA